MFRWCDRLNTHTATDAAAAATALLRYEPPQFYFKTLSRSHIGGSPLSPLPWRWVLSGWVM